MMGNFDWKKFSLLTEIRLQEIYETVIQENKEFRSFLEKDFNKRKDIYFFSLSIPHWVREIMYVEHHKHIVKELELAQIYMTMYFLYYDEMLDRKDDACSEKVALLTKVQSKAEFYMHKVIPQHMHKDFWNLYYKMYLDIHTRSVFWEMNYFKNSYLSENCLEDLTCKLGDKSQLLFWPAAAFCSLEQLNIEIFDSLHYCFRLFCQVLVLLDDIYDYPDDVKNNQINSVLFCANFPNDDEFLHISVYESLNEVLSLAEKKLKEIKNSVSPDITLYNFCDYLHNCISNLGENIFNFVADRTLLTVYEKINKKA